VGEGEAGEATGDRCQSVTGVGPPRFFRVQTVCIKHCNRPKGRNDDRSHLSPTAPKAGIKTAVQSLREKERGDETQFTTKIGGKTSLGPSYFVL